MFPLISRNNCTMPAYFYDIHGTNVKKFERLFPVEELL